MDAKMAETFRSIPYGVYLLTAGQGAALHTVIVSWVSQVSFSPPRLMVALRHNRGVIPAIRESRVFSLSLLSVSQRTLMARLKGPLSPGQSAEFFDEEDSSRPPVLRGCLAGWRCRFFSEVEAGDHFLFLGEVESVSPSRQGLPLTTLDLGKTYLGEF